MYKNSLVIKQLKVNLFSSFIFRVLWFLCWLLTIAVNSLILLNRPNSSFKTAAVTCLDLSNLKVVSLAAASSPITGMFQQINTSRINIPQCGQRMPSASIDSGKPSYISSIPTHTPQPAFVVKEQSLRRYKLQYNNRKLENCYKEWELVIVQIATQINFEAGSGNML